jgi:hypothetical protein
MYAYGDYIEASRNYVESLHLTCLANDPGLYINEVRQYSFYWKEASKQQSGKYSVKPSVVELYDVFKAALEIADNSYGDIVGIFWKGKVMHRVIEFVSDEKNKKQIDYLKR